MGITVPISLLLPPFPENQRQRMFFISFLMEVNSESRYEVNPLTKGKNTENLSGQILTKTSPYIAKCPPGGERDDGRACTSERAYGG